MNGADAGPPDEFETIATLLAPLTRGHPAALGLLDDAAVLPGRPGFDLVLSQDAMVAGVHFLPEAPMDLVARRLLRAALSDLAAKAAEPFGYMLTLAWPAQADRAQREAFARGLAEDADIFDLALLGGDTVSTPGPFTASATVLGWTPAGAMVRRSGARPGDLLAVSGTIGDGWLGLLAAQGKIAPHDHLLRRFHRPEPRFDLRSAIQRHARSTADVSDGLLADAGRLAIASGLGVTVELDRLPLSAPARAWLAAQPDRGVALASLASGGDDYEIVMAVAPDALDELRQAAGAAVTVVGQFEAGKGVRAQAGGAPRSLDRLGWSHG